MHQQQYILLVVFQGWGDGVRQPNVLWTWSWRAFQAVHEICR